MITDLIGQRVAIHYGAGHTTEGIVRAIDLSQKQFSADMILVVQKDDGSLATCTGRFVTVVKAQASGEAK